MAILTSANRAELRSLFAQKASSIWEVIAVNKSDLRAAVEAIDLCLSLGKRHIAQSITLTWRWRLRRFVRERNWRNARDWFRERIWRRLGYLGLDHSPSFIPLIIRYIRADKLTVLTETEMVLGEDALAAP